ncbi:hypothetical protein ACVOMV_02380 [Mesorhizobium atlanticum]
MADKSQIGLTAVDTVPLHEKVYLELVRALMSGQLQPGQKLTSRKLARSSAPATCRCAAPSSGCRR